MLAVVLALAASLTYGLSDFLGGLTSRSVSLLSVLFVSQTTALLLLIANAALLQNAQIPDSRYIGYAVLAGMSGMLGTAAIYRGLAVGTMSIVAPVGAVTPVIPVILGLFLGEIPTSLQGLGIALAVAGIVLTSMTRSPQGTPATSRVAAISVLFGAISAVGFGVSFTAIDAASEGGVSWALLVARLTAVAILVSAVVYGRSAFTLRVEDVPKLAFIGVLVIGADSLYAVASTVGLLGIVAVLSSLYPIATIALARIYLREKVAPLQKVGILMCLSGVVIIVS